MFQSKQSDKKFNSLIQQRTLMGLMAELLVSMMFLKRLAFDGLFVLFCLPFSPYFLPQFANAHQFRLFSQMFQFTFP